jgi:hypothetical protein
MKKIILIMVLVVISAQAWSKDAFPFTIILNGNSRDIEATDKLDFFNQCSQMYNELDILNAGMKNGRVVFDFLLQRATQDLNFDSPFKTDSFLPCRYMLRNAAGISMGLLGDPQVENKVKSFKFVLKDQSNESFQFLVSFENQDEFRALCESSIDERSINIKKTYYVDTEYLPNELIYNNGTEKRVDANVMKPWTNAVDICQALSLTIPK